jgi:RNA polymerase sigma-70 factor, ECF subfamily
VVRPIAETRAEFETVRMAQRGDQAAFEALVLAHQTRVFNYALRLLGDRSLAEDVTQEVFLRVFQVLPTFAFRCRFTTWLFQVTKNRVLDELQAIDRRPRHLVELQDVPSLDMVDAKFERGETVAAVWQAIDGLSTDLKMALLLREVAGLSYPEIAETLEVTLPTVKWRIFHARETVALALAQGDIEELGSRIPA